jgi:hypothetical protein
MITEELSLLIGTVVGRTVENLIQRILRGEPLEGVKLSDVVGSTHLTELARKVADERARAVLEKP